MKFDLDDFRKVCATRAAYLYTIQTKLSKALTKSYRVSVNDRGLVFGVVIDVSEKGSIELELFGVKAQTLTKEIKLDNGFNILLNYTYSPKHLSDKKAKERLENTSQKISSHQIFKG